MLKVVENTAVAEEEVGPQTLDEIALAGARQMLKKALEAADVSYIERHKDARDERGRALVVRNGPPREACDLRGRHDRGEAAAGQRQAS